MKDTQSPLPQGWVWTTLGEVSLDPQYGWTTKAVEEGSLHILRTTDITSGQIDWKGVPYCLDEPPVKEKYLLKDGDVVISRAGSVGFSHLIKNPKAAVFASYLIRFRPIINEQFFAYFLKSPPFWQAISEKSVGIALQNVNASKLRQIVIPIAPLPEQHSIVMRIEELLTQLDAGVASLKKVQTQLKYYRQAVLKQIFEGKNTSQDLGKDPQKNWKLLHLKDITIEKVGLRRGPFGSSIKKSFFVPHGYKVYEQGNAINDDPYRGTYYINEEKFNELKSFQVIPGDLIVSCSGVTLGRITEIPNDAEVGIINQALLRVRLNQKIIRNSYFIRLFRTDFFQRLIFSYSQGTAMPNLVAIKDFKEIEIFVPPIQEQDLLISDIELHLSICEKLDQTIAQSLKQAETLRHSILKRAFEGKLVPQDPDDEPASILLERIKAEKARHAIETKKGKTLQPKSPKRKVTNGN